MNGTRAQSLATTLVVAFVLAACESGPMQPVSSGSPKAELQFMDLQGFDRDLAASLSVPMPKVEVTFYDRVAPSAVPERLQRWMASVETGGGTVKVVPPQAGATTRSLLLLISSISSLWSASKAVKDMSTQAQFNAAKMFDAEIILKRDESGEAVVDKVVFLQRNKR